MKRKVPYRPSRATFIRAAYLLTLALLISQCLAWRVQISFARMAAADYRAQADTRYLVLSASHYRAAFERQSAALEQCEEIIELLQKEKEKGLGQWQKY